MHFDNKDFGICYTNLLFLVAADSIPLPCHLILLMYFDIEAVPLFVFVLLTKKL